MVKKKAKKVAKKTAKKVVKKTAKVPARKAKKRAAVKKKAVVKKAKVVKKAAKVIASKKKSVAKKTVKVKRAVVTKQSVSKRDTVVAIAPPKVKKAPSDVVVDAVIKGIQEKKGQNLVCLDLRKIENSVCDYFVICEANSRTQVAAIADSIKDEVKKLTGVRPFRSEGYQNAEWILIDYITTVVHVFQPEIRDFYNLEGLWADAEKMEVAETN